MIHGMLCSTQMLQSYMELGWIRHPDVSSALVVAALQMEGKAVDASSTKDKLALAAARLSTASDPASARAMATAADALAAARLSTASDPASARALFWESIARGNARAASEAATRVSVPPRGRYSLTLRRYGHGGGT